tara:strand:- start:98 stop:469 length:372 start_codon:yes stop_codon:yes gene_type:complete
MVKFYEITNKVFIIILLKQYLIFMKIDKKTVERLAELSKLEFSEKEKEGMVQDFQKIVHFVDKLKELDTEGVKPLVYVNENVTNVLREDSPGELVSREDALKNAPVKDTNYIKIPNVLKIKKS